MRSIDSSLVAFGLAALLMAGCEFHTLATSDAPNAWVSVSATTPVAMTARDAETALFLDKAAQAALFEIEASTLALKQSTSARITGYAEVMIKDHSRLMEELRLAAGNLSLPAELEAPQVARLTQLKRSGGADFDRFYVADVAVAAHEDAVALFDAFGRQGPDGPVKQFAQKNLPTLQGHLRMGKDLQPLATTALAAR